MAFKQRYLHFYGLNEAIHLAFLAWAWTYLSGGSVSLTLAAYAAFYVLNVAVMMAILLIRRLFRRSRAVRKTVALPDNIHPLPDFDVFYHTTRDGVKLRVMCTEPKTPLKRKATGGFDATSLKKTQKAKRNSKPVMLLALPLGQNGQDIFNPVFAHYGDEFVYITWDYRGFFSSSSPPTLRRMSIANHAMDAREVLNACGYDFAHVMIGHSMGTTVAFETVLLYPDAVGSLVILNGFHGHVFQTAFQPLVRLPFSSDCVGALIEFLLAHPNLLDKLRRMLAPVLGATLPMYAKVFGSSLMKSLHGDTYLLDFFNSYMGTIYTNLRNTKSWLRMFQELDAHSVYHLLPTIKQPVLLISGLLDTITPPLQSVECARRIPHAVHYCDPTSTHASILESPEWCVAEIDVFLGDVLNGDDDDKKER